MGIISHAFLNLYTIIATKAYVFKLLDRKRGIRIMVERQMSIGCTARIVSHETGSYLRGIVGLDSWTEFAVALKAFADSKPARVSGDTTQNAVYLMLMGYALEDLAKCIIARKAYTPAITDVTPFEEKFEEFRFKRRDGQVRRLKIHDLDDLYSAENLGFEVSDTEIEHLKAISIYTLWKGRYPVPLEIGHVPTSEPSFDDLSATAENVYDRAKAEVERLQSLRS